MLLFAMLVVVRSGAADLPLDRIRLPDGFSISLFARDVPGARSLALGDRGTLFVGARGQGVVYGLRDLDQPNGVAFRAGAFFVTEARRVLRFGPDGMLYVLVGASCNVCEPPDDRYATILRMRPDGSGLEVFARGVRNTVGFDWHPGTGEL